MAASTVRREGKTFDIVNLTLLMILLVLLLYPLFFTVVASLSEPSEVVKGNVVFWVKGFTLESYQMAFNESRIWRGYANSLFYTVFGTLFNLCLTIPAAYFVSKKELPGRQIINVYFLITMYFSGGLVPQFLLMRALGLLNSWWAIPINGAVSATNLIIARSFFVSGIPAELEEAAEIDGCSVLQSFLRIVLPLSKAMLSVILLYYAVARWNNYTTALYYLPMAEEKYPLQMVLRQLLITMQATVAAESSELAAYYADLANQLKYAVIVIASVPLLVIYPFIQKYFEKGVMLGSVKG